MTPADRSGKSLRVGVVVAVALGLAMAGTFLIGREQRFWERRVSYEIRFARANGLRTGSQVSLTGVDIGSVQSVWFPDDPNANYISAEISVTGRAAPRIREDSVARIRTLGLLGDKYIEISGGSPNAPELPPGSLIPSQDPLDIEGLLGEGGDIITNIVEVTTSAKNVLAAIENGEGLLGQMVKNREQGAATLTDVQRSVAHVEATTASLERIMKDVEAGKGAFGVMLKRGGEADRLLKNLDRTSAELQKLVTRLGGAQGALPQLIEDEAYGRRLLSELERTLKNLSEVTEKVNRGSGTAAQLVNDPSLYRDAKALVAAARSSWVFSVYRGARGLFPPYAPPPDAAPSPAPTLRPSP